MPKLKTNKGVAKRFKVTKSGRLKRHKAGHSHILTKKPEKEKGSSDTTPWWTKKTKRE